MDIGQASLVRFPPDPESVHQPHSVSTADRIAPQQIGGFRPARMPACEPAADGDNWSVQVSRAAVRARSMRAAMTKEERRELEAALARLRQEHRDLDAA